MPPAGMTLTSREGTRWRFDAGTLFTEFLLTGGPGELARFDALAAPADLAAWAATSRLGLRVESVDISPQDVTRARALRDALWRTVRCVIADSAPNDEDLAVINRTAAGPALAPQIDRVGQPSWLLPATGSAVLSTVARDAIGVLTGPSRDRLRECAAADCQLVFLDTSRPGARRWCSMERCGNRHKVRAMRSRRTTSVAPQTESPDEGVIQ